MKKNRFFAMTRRTVSNLLVVLLGVSFYLFLSNYQLCMGRLRDFYNIISPFVAAFVVAFLLNAPMTWFEQKVFFKLKRKRLLAVLVTYVLALLIMGGLVIAVLPEVGMSAVTLIENLPAYLESIGGMVSEIAAKFHLDLNSAEALVGSWEEFVAALVTAIQKLIPQFIDFSVALGNGIINTVMALIVSVYMLVSKDTLKRQCKKATYALFPAERAERIMQISRRSHVVFSGFINGKILDSAIIGVLCFVVISMLQLDYAALISLIVGVTNMIPFFGPFIGAIPCIVILVIVDPWQAIVFAVFIFILQQFDGNILGPKILGNSTGLSPMWVLLAIVIGGGLFGFAGMLIGVPTFAVLYSIVSDYLRDRLKRKGIDEKGEPLTGREPGEEEVK